jgi:hypothetical protein
MRIVTAAKAKTALKTKEIFRQARKKERSKGLLVRKELYCCHPPRFAMKRSERTARELRKCILSA